MRPYAIGSAAAFRIRALAGSFCSQNGLYEFLPYALDNDPRHVDMAIRRWQKLTGEAAVLVSDGRTFVEIAAERAVVEVA